ncbi:protein SPT2 homolog [Hetaerina americana]|uniref:protein SPT2 homolog n=1 Tax=Hetaerina americana TaxID=62018 RepID=UPI003A7F56A7
MDFGELLSFAKQNEKPAKEVKCYRTSFAPPKKEQKTKALSANIQKFLARKEEEEKRKLVEADKKRDELLALRAQDSKANKRVRAMLKSTKAANKAAIDDARDDVNTAVTMAGPSQPDEDDYGYVSQEASAFYNKLMDKYVSTPSEDPKFSRKSQTVKDLVSTKDRVRMALLKEEEEESMGHKRKRKRSKKEDKEKDEDICYDAPDRDVLEKEVRNPSRDMPREKPEPEIKKKKRPVAPPPMNFSDLLKVAAQKQFEPIKVEKKEVKEEDERPMTKKQKEEYLREKQYRMKKEEMARMAANKGKEKPHQSNSPQQVQEEARSSPVAKSPSVPRIPKLNGAKAAPDSNYRMQGNDNEQQMKKRESQQSSVREMSQMKQHVPEAARQNSTSRPHSSAGEQDYRSNDVRRNSLQQSHKVRESYQDARPSPAQNVPSLKEKRAAIEEKKLMRDPPRSEVKDDRRSSNPAPKPVIKEERSQMRPTSKPVIKEERDLSNSSPKPVIRDDRKQSSNSMRPPVKEERRTNPPESSRLPVKPSKVNNGASSSKYDQPVNRDGGIPKAPTDPMRRIEERPSKNVPNPSASSLLKDRLSSPNNQSLPSKTTPSSNQQPKKANQEGRVALPGQRQGAPVRQSVPGDNRNRAPINRPQSSGTQGPSRDVAREPSRDAPRGPSRDAPRVPSRDEPRGPSRDAPRGPSRDAPRVPSRDEPRGPSRDAPRGPSRDAPRGPSRDAPRVPSRDEPRGPSRDAPRGPSRDGPSGPPGRRQDDRGEVRRPMMPPGRGPPGGRFLPPGRPRPQGMRRPAKRRIESDDEYDSELDDFIDDGPEEGEDYSKYIKEIFGYDKSRYSRVEYEDDDECMESNFAQQMKEEFVSTKLGILEDLEDIKKEQMEKQKKKAVMMKKKRL